ncbi:cyclic nucleotide-binding-like protein, partial [Baffinella frigidus]
SNETDLAINRSIRDVTDFLQYVDLPRVFQTRAKQHLFYTLKKAPHLATHPLENLPRRFRNEILDQVTLSTLGATPFFQSVDADCRSQFASMLRPISLRAGEYLFKALETGMEMYFLVSGEVDVWDIDETMIVGKLVRGDFVGEIALFEEAFPCRTSSVKARTDVELLELRRYRVP